MALCEVKKGAIFQLRSRYVPGSGYGTLSEKQVCRIDLPAGSRGRILSMRGTEIRVEVFEHPSNVTQDSAKLQIPLQMFNFLFEAADTRGWPVLEKAQSPADF